MKRKTPVRHTVRGHKRRGKWVDSFQRGRGQPRTKTKTVGGRLSQYRDAIERHKPDADRYIHTTGIIIVDEDTVLKPLEGVKETVDHFGKPKKMKFKTYEYDAIKALEDLPNIPKDTEKIIIDGIPYLKRGNYIVVEDFKDIPRKALIELEKTMREANKRGWSYGDTPQVAFDRKTRRFLWHDWSTAVDRVKEGHPQLARDDAAIYSLWSKAGYAEQSKDRESAESLRFDYNLGVEHKDHPGIYRQEDEPYLNYAYLSYARPPSFMWMNLLPKDAVITYINPPDGWRSMGTIYTVEPLSDKAISSYELVPTKYVWSDMGVTK